MAKTKKQDAPKREFTKAEAFYIEQNWGKLTPEQMAVDLGCTDKLVEAYIAKLEEAGVKKPDNKKPSKAEKAGFAVHDPVNDEGEKGKSFSTSMTGASSHIGDEATKKASDGGKDFMNTRLKDAIHVIDPKLPCR